MDGWETSWEKEMDVLERGEDWALHGRWDHSRDLGCEESVEEAADAWEDA